MKKTPFFLQNMPGLKVLSRPKLPRTIRHYFPVLVFCVLAIGIALQVMLYGLPYMSEPALPVLAPHRALYDIELVRTQSGAQVTNVQGKMLYEWQPDCDGWISTHKFNLYYDYADSPSLRMTSSFSTYESYDGHIMTYTSERRRDGHVFQQLRGEAHLKPDLSGNAVYTMPQDLEHELPKGTLFPMSHTYAVFKALNKHKRFFTATVFDGSDDEGPVQINAFLGERKAIPESLQAIENPEFVDMALLPENPHHIRLAFFPKNTEDMDTEYEMDMLLHDNGVISEMVVDYDKFTVRQRLIALEPTKNLCHE